MKQRGFLLVLTLKAHREQEATARQSSTRRPSPSARTQPFVSTDGVHLLTLDRRRPPSGGGTAHRAHSGTGRYHPCPTPDPTVTDAWERARNRFLLNVTPPLRWVIRPPVWLYWFMRTLRHHQSPPWRLRLPDHAEHHRRPCRHGSVDRNPHDFLHVGYRVHGLRQGACRRETGARVAGAVSDRADLFSLRSPTPAVRTY